jgi:hypothetical protein
MRNRKGMIKHKKRKIHFAAQNEREKVGYFLIYLKQNLLFSSELIVK